VPTAVIWVCEASTLREWAMFSPLVAPEEVKPVPAVRVDTKFPVVSVAKTTLLAAIVATPASETVISPDNT
jgi:hypothetical protein